jgi:hypothetical protein
VPAWEEENGIQFLVDDIRIVDVILLEQEVKDAEREAKKVRLSHLALGGCSVFKLSGFYPPIANEDYGWQRYPCKAS